MKVRVSVVAKGRVQGVTFRHYTYLRAMELGVTGWVRNLPGGSVEGLFEGDEPAVQTLVAWCSKGPPAARVEQVDTRQGVYTGEFGKFAIAY